MTKQVIIVRKDLNMSPGKLAAQVAHASMGALLKSLELDLREFKGKSSVGIYANLDSSQPAFDFLTGSFTKVVLQVESEAELQQIYEEALESGIVAANIVDEGRTELNGPTFTCVGLGPEESSKLDAVTGHLRLYK